MNVWWKSSLYFFLCLFQVTQNCQLKVCSATSSTQSTHEKLSGSFEIFSTHFAVQSRYNLAKTWPRCREIAEIANRSQNLQDVQAAVENCGCGCGRSMAFNGVHQDVPIFPTFSYPFLTVPDMSYLAHYHLELDRQITLDLGCCDPCEARFWNWRQALPTI